MTARHHPQLERSLLPERTLSIGGVKNIPPWAFAAVVVSAVTGGPSFIDPGVPLRIDLVAFFVSVLLSVAVFSESVRIERVSIANGLVRFYRRTIFRSDSWEEPVRNYQGVQIVTTPRAGQHGLIQRYHFVISLVHAERSSRTVEIKSFSSRSRSSVEQRARDVARAIGVSFLGERYFDH